MFGCFVLYFLLLVFFHSSPFMSIVCCPRELLLKMQKKGKTCWQILLYENCPFQHCDNNLICIFNASAIGLCFLFVLFWENAWNGYTWFNLVCGLGASHVYTQQSPVRIKLYTVVYMYARMHSMHLATGRISSLLLN